MQPVPAEADAVLRAQQLALSSDHAAASEAYAALAERYDGIELHLVGPLQTNKARQAVQHFDLIHSVDSERLAGEINRHAAAAGKLMSILIQVNVSGEESKGGFGADEVGAGPVVELAIGDAGCVAGGGSAVAEVARQRGDVVSEEQPLLLGSSSRLSVALCVVLCRSRLVLVHWSSTGPRRFRIG